MAENTNTEREACAILSKICDLFQIGIQARTESTIIMNVENAIHHARLLHAVERDLFPQPELPEDDDPYASVDDELPAPNSWAAKDEADYVAQFRAALAARASLSLPAVGQEPDGINHLGAAESAHETITKVIHELRTYNPLGDEYGGKHVHKGWADQLESVAPPKISELDSEYWLRNRAAILRAISERGFQLVSSGGLFWLSGAAPQPAVAAGWTKASDQLPPCRDDAEYIGINTAGFAGIFNAVADIAGNVHCMMETPEESVSIMSDLDIWTPFVRPAPSTEGESNG